MGSRARLVVLFIIALPLCAISAPAQLDVDLVGGAYFEAPTFESTSIAMQGDPGRQYLLMLSLIPAPGAGTTIPNLTLDIDLFNLVFLNLSLQLPGFFGVFDVNGNAGTTLAIPALPELETFPIWFQLIQTVDGGNKFESKSTAQVLTPQFKDSFRTPKTTIAPGFLVDTVHTVNRSTHTLTYIPSLEAVLVTGGGDDGITTSSGQITAELYHLANEEIEDLGPIMVQERTGHSGTLLDDGRVLLVGGADFYDVPQMTGGEPTNTAEVFDPVSKTFSPVGNLFHGPRALHRATKLDDGRVLLSGGTDNYIDPASILTGAYASTEIFDPLTDTFSAGPDMSIPRLGHTATLLDDGRVLLVGGSSWIEILSIKIPFYSASTEFYIPAAGQPGTTSAFVDMPNSPFGRFGHEQVKLANGDVLIAGGANGSDPFDPQPESTWELFLAATDDWVVTTGPLTDDRMVPTANLLPDGTVLIAGGATGGFTTPESVGTSEIWDPVSQISTAAANMLQDRAGHLSVNLPDGTVLLTGGGTGDGVGQGGLDSLEIYQP